MKPLSKKSRFSYIVLLILVFIVVAPLLIMFASGYRIDKAFKIARTGGIYVTASQSGTEIYLGAELAGKTSIFQKSVFVQNLKPSTYNISVKKTGYQEWSKTLKVFPETVTEAYSFILPNDVILTEIPQRISQQNLNNTLATSSSAKTIENPEYLVTSKLFIELKATTTATKIATSTKNIKELRKLLVENIGGELRISWKGELDSKPAYFCQNEICKDEIFIKPHSKLKSFDFFPGRDDLVIISTEDGIYVSEIDDRSKQNIQKLYEGKNADFRIKDGDKIFLKVDKKIYLLSL